MKIKKSIILLLIIFNNFSYGEMFGKAINGNSNDLQYKTNSVAKEVREKLGDFYSNSETLNTDTDVQIGDWQTISRPFNCSHWIYIGNNIEERTCNVKRARMNKSTEIQNEKFIKNLELEWEEEIQMIKERRFSK